MYIKHKTIHRQWPSPYTSTAMGQMKVNNMVNCMASVKNQYLKWC